LHLLPATQWKAYEAGRQSLPLAHSGGVVVTSGTRMAFEQNAVLWELNVSNPSASPVVLNLTLELAGTVSLFSTVGTWVYTAPNDASAYTYAAIGATHDSADVSRTTVGDRTDQRGVTSIGHAAATDKEKSAATRFVFVGDLQPDTVWVPPKRPPSPWGR
jgi:hypothetical protein